MPDARVEAAISNWAPRFVSQGVDFNDFRRTTERLERWEDWLGAWVENGELHQGLALTYRIAFLFQPPDDNSVLHLHAPLGQDDLLRHMFLLGK